MGGGRCECKGNGQGRPESEGGQGADGDFADGHGQSALSALPALHESLGRRPSKRPRLPRLRLLLLLSSFSLQPVLIEPLAPACLPVPRPSQNTPPLLIMPRLLRVAAAQVGRVDRATPRADVLARLINLLEVSHRPHRLLSLNSDLADTLCAPRPRRTPPRRRLTSLSSPRRPSRPSSPGTTSRTTPSWRRTLRRSRPRASRTRSRPSRSSTARASWAWTS